MSGIQALLIVGVIVAVGAITGHVTRKLSWPFWKGFLVGVVMMVVFPAAGPIGLWLFCFFIQKRQPNDLT